MFPKHGLRRIRGIQDPSWAHPRDRFAYWNIHVNDYVQIMTGQDKGKVGRVSEVEKVKNTIKVEGLKLGKQVVKRFQRPQLTAGAGEYIMRERPIHISNVRLVLNKDAIPPIAESKDPEHHFAMTTSPLADTPVFTARRLKRVGRFRSIRVYRGSGPKPGLRWLRVAKLGKRQTARLLQGQDPAKTIKDFGGSNLESIKKHSATPVRWGKEGWTTEEKVVGPFDTPQEVASDWTFRPYDLMDSGLPEGVVDDLRGFRRAKKENFAKMLYIERQARKEEKRKLKAKSRPKKPRVFKARLPPATIEVIG